MDNIYFKLERFKFTNVLNLSDVQLGPHEESLLSKGLGFIPTTGLNFTNTKLGISKFINRLKIQNFFYKSDHLTNTEHIKFDPFKLPSTWSPHDSLTPKAITDFQIQLNQFLDSTPKNYKLRDNLTPEERDSLKKLKNNKNIIIKPADKGQGIVVLNTSDYILEANRQLNDTTIYSKTKNPQALTINDNIREILYEMHARKLINDNNLKFLAPPLIHNSNSPTDPCPDPPKPRRFYLLPKIHKDPKDWFVPDKIPKARPIVSDVNSGTYNLSKFITTHLEPLATDHPSYIKNSLDLKNKLSLIQIPTDALLVTMDVESLYTNINNTLGLNCIKHKLDQNPHPINNFIIQLLDILLNHNDFTFNGQTYLQLDGTPMGARYSVAYANIFMAHLENEAINKCTLKPTAYYRYIDDIFCIWTHGPDTLKIFIDTLNSICHNIKITPLIDNSEVVFLDLVIFKNKLNNISCTLLTKTYFKPTDTHQLLHHSSYHPKHTFNGIIKSQIIRFYRNSSKLSDFEHSCKILFAALCSRGYNKRKLRSIKLNTLKYLNPQNSTNFSGKSQPCQSAHCKTCPLFLNTNHLYYNDNIYPVTGFLNCNSLNVIYTIRCTLCNLIYVGQTTDFRRRFWSHRHHITKNSNHLGHHFNLEHHSIKNVEIVLLEQIHCNNSTLLKSKLLTREKYWIEKLNTFHAGLNLDPGGNIIKNIPLVVPYSKLFLPAQTIISQNFDALNDLAPFKNTRPLIAYSKNPSLKNLLVSSKDPRPI